MINLRGLLDNLWQLRYNFIYTLHTSHRFQLPKDKMTYETCGERHHKRLNTFGNILKMQLQHLDHDPKDQITKVF